MRVVDSVGWIEYFSKGPLVSAYREYILSTDEVVTPAIVLYEVYKRILNEFGENASASAAGQMMKTRVVGLDATLALAAAEISAKHKLPMADAIIYATAQAEDAVVVTSDEHFRNLPGVEFIERT